MRRIRRIAHETVLPLADEISVYPGPGISRILVRDSGVSLALFASDAGKESFTASPISETLVFVLDGTCRIRLGDRAFEVHAGECIATPRAVPRTIYAVEPVKWIQTFLRPETPDESDNRAGTGSMNSEPRPADIIQEAETVSYIRNIAHETVLNLADEISAQPGQIVSKTLAQNSAVSLTLFAFAQGEEISTHESTGDAFVHVLEGTGRFTVGGKEHLVHAGEGLVMPAGIPHSVYAPEAFKWILTVIFPQGAS